MRIQINDEYFLTTDERNYILTHVTVSKGEKTKGEVKERHIGFFSSVEQVLKHWAKLELLASDATSLSEVKTQIDEQNKIIEGLLKDVR